MEETNDLLRIIEEKFTHREEVGNQLFERLLSVPLKAKKAVKFNWFAAASVLVLLSVNALAISKNTKTSKEQYILEQYALTDDNFSNYE